MLLSELAKAAGTEVLAVRGDCEIAGLSMDSRKEIHRGLFFCVPGARFDAHDFAPQALKNGADALVVTHFLDLDVPQVQVKNVRGAMSLMAAAFECACAALRCRSTSALYCSSVMMLAW